MMTKVTFLLLFVLITRTNGINGNKDRRAAYDGALKSGQFPRLGLESWFERITIPTYLSTLNDAPSLYDVSIDDPLKMFSQEYTGRSGEVTPPHVTLSRGRGQCDVTINQEITWISSPNYPENYDDNTGCLYNIQRYKGDVCEIEYTFDDFNLQDTRPTCDSDHFDPGNGNKMCGTLVPGLKIRVTFPSDVTYITASFKSDYRRTRKGFLIKIRQIRNSCKDGIYRTTNNNVINTPYEDTNYPDVSIRNTIDFHPKSSSCDQLITSNKGYIQSPRFPAPYGPNSVCIYTIQRANADVCKVELKMRRFDVSTKSTRRDGACIDYLELPDRRKLCGKLNDRMTLDFSKYSDNIVLMFKSDFGSSAGGFDIDVIQVPNSCYSSEKGARKCDQRLRSYTSKVISPNYPWSYQPNTFCMYTVEPVDSRMCYFSIEFNKFELDGINGNYDDMCTKDYFQLPDGHRICSNHTGRKTYMFPSGLNRVAAFYFSSDDKAQGPGYDLTIRQHSCDENINPSYGDPIIPSTTCDQFISKERDMILSPGYPNDYSSGMTCQYSILKYADDVCYLRVKFITFDVEDHPDCRSDYLLIQSTGEKICGSSLRGTRADKLIPFSSSGKVEMKFITDSQVTRSGFKLLLEQVRNSCVLSPDMIIGLPGGPTYPAASSNSPAIPFGRPSSIIPSVPPRMCNFTTSSRETFYSDNYPNAYRSNVDCVYRVYRSSGSICSVEIFFRSFSVGTWENRNCVNDFLKVGQMFYCGYRKNERLITEFPPGLDFIDLRFYSDSSVNYPGFILDIRQLDTCRPGHSVDRRGRKLPFDQGVEITQVVDSVTPSTGTSGGPFCGTRDIRSETFDIISTNYDRATYDKWSDCHYKIHKSHYTVCALEVTFMSFSLEESPNCIKDFLQFGKDGVKLCGRLPKGTTRTFEFTGDEMEIKFHADGQIEDTGYFMTGKQIRC